MFKKVYSLYSAFYPSLRFTLSLQSAFYTDRFAFAVPLLALNLRSTFLLLRSFVCKSFPARISSHLLNPPLLSLLFSFICLRYWVVIHRP